MTHTRRRFLGDAAWASAGLAAGGLAARAGDAATLDEIRQRGTMSVATEDDYEPFEYVKDGKPTGYDQDLLDAMKRTVPFRIRQDIVPWTGILPGVANGKYDAAVTAVVVTAGRMRTLDFASPVAQSTDFYLKKAGDTTIMSIRDLSGKSIGVEADGAVLRRLPQLAETLKATGGTMGKVVQYQGYSQAYRDLALGRVDVVVNAELSLKSVLATKPGVFEIGQPVGKPTYIAWAVQKGNADLLKLFDDFLLGTRRDGSMYALQKTYFGMTFESMPTEPVANG